MTWEEIQKKCRVAFPKVVSIHRNKNVRTVVLLELSWARLKYGQRIFLNRSFINHMFCVFVRIASPRQF